MTTLLMTLAVLSLTRCSHLRAASVKLAGSQPVSLGLRSMRRAAARANVHVQAMESEREPRFITTPIYYVNGRPHIGHVYTSLSCDVVARFSRLDGHEVLFLTGTDEHGQKVEQSAQAAQETPLELADRVSGIFRSLLPLYDFSCDQFIRTTEERHKIAAQASFRPRLCSETI